MYQCKLDKNINVYVNPSFTNPGCNKCISDRLSDIEINNCASILKSLKTSQEFWNNENARRECRNAILK